VVHRDATRLVLDKPPHLPTAPHPEWPRSLLDVARALWPGAAPAHRLDEGTSGLVVFRAQGGGPDPLESVEKTYLALANGVTRKGGTIRAPLREGGRKLAATTRFRRVDVIGGHSLLELQLDTGRTHQIRRHLATLGHPVLGDERYGNRKANRHVLARAGLHRPFLHATRLRWPDGLELESPLWPDLQLCLEALDRPSTGPGV
jgi:23S rRNA (uracil1939-C5)-methyltransferase